MSKRPVRPTAVPTVALDRREFIAAAGTAVAASVLPLSVAVAAHAHVEFDRLADGEKKRAPYHSARAL